MTDPIPSLADALANTDAALAHLDEVIAGLGDGDLHLAHRGGGWTTSQVISHINLSVLLWAADVGRVAADPDLDFVFREEVGHDALGYGPPTVEVARRQLASTRRTVATVVPAVPQDVLDRELTIPDLGTMTVGAWTPLILGHAGGHAEQALEVLRDRGAIA